MRVLVVGATGTIGKALVAALARAHEVVPASRSSRVRVDIEDAQSIRDMYRSVGRVGAVVSAAGSAAFKPLADLTDPDFDRSLRNKLMGQVNLVRFGIGSVDDGGSFTLTSGSMAREPMVKGAAISLVNAGLEGFVRGAAIELPRGIRVNAVAPPWITETLREYGMTAPREMTAAEAARLYVRSVEGSETGGVIG